jgi:hypothetical protein
MTPGVCQKRLFRVKPVVLKAAAWRLKRSESSVTFPGRSHESEPKLMHRTTIFLCPVACLKSVMRLAQPAAKVGDCVLFCLKLGFLPL